ncbi:MAG: sulfatase-like hydrolase/transferase [Candidatus Sumerlaeota bacterium]
MMPKVVLIMTDTQRKDMVGCYGNPDMKTPCLDKIAAEGIRFERAYTCQPVCGPARAALFTGTFPHSNGSWANSIALGDNVKTVGQRLSDKGIHTAYIGKWHLDGGDYFGHGICPDGWDPDYWFDMRNYLEGMSEEERARSRQASLNRDPDLKAEFTYAHQCSDRAVDFLQKHGGEDFLLVVSYDEPHGPFVCPKPYSEMYTDYAFPKSPNVYDTLEDKPEHIRVWAETDHGNQNPEELEIRRPDYFGCNSFVDMEIGRVMEAVDAHASDALVIYTSDHGDALHSHGIGNKGPTVFEEVTNIPFLVRWPGQAPVGAFCEHPVSHIDVVPTILDALGQPIPKLLEGRSMTSQLRDPSVRVNDEIFIEFGRYEIDHDGFGGYQPMRACFDGRYKLAINLMTSDELYDIQEDPHEMQNLINSPDHAEIRNRLHDRIIDWMNETRDPFRGYYWERRPWRKDARPASWGYTRMTRQREHEEYEPRQLDYDTGLPMKEAVRKK